MNKIPQSVETLKVSLRSTGEKNKIKERREKAEGGRRKSERKENVTNRVLNLA